MSDILKSIFAGITATPFILLFTIGIGLACGLNTHFLLVSVLLTNIVGVIFNRESPYFFNVGPGLVVLMFMLNDSIGMESGHLPTFIIFVIPAIFFTILSLLPINYPLIPNRVVAILAFGIGGVVILKQLPNAFAYSTILQSEFTIAGEETSFLAASTTNNWVQLSLALLIPVTALIGLRFKKGNAALLFSLFLCISIGYLLGYDTTPVSSSVLTFDKPFQLDWTISPDILLEAASNGITVAIIMLIFFLSDFSMLEYNPGENKTSMKKSLRVVGVGNLISGLFGVMPTNISLVDSYVIGAFGGSKWVSKLPVIITLMIIAFTNIPDFNLPMFAFAGVLIYVGILLLIKSWKILNELHWVDYIFTVIIGLILILTDFILGFIIAVMYALIYFLIKKMKDNYLVQKDG